MGSYRPDLRVSATAVPSAVLKKDHVNEVHSNKEGSMKMNVDGDGHRTKESNRILKNEICRGVNHCVKS